MIRRYLIMIAACTGFIVSNTYAGTDPIGWSQSGSVPSTVQLNQSYSVSFTLVNQLPFTMPTPLYIQNNATPASEVIPHKKIVTQTPSGTHSQIQAQITNGFPTSIASNSTYPISITFTNTGAALSNVTLSQNAGNSAGFTQTYTNCTSSLGASPNNTCIVTGTFTTSNASGNVQEGYTLASGNISGSATTSSIISNSATATRSFTFINNCSQSVWFGLNGGAVSSAGCSSDSDCAQGSSCNPSAASGAGECFYNNPVPTNGSYLLTANNGTGPVTVYVTDYGLQYVWSGNMAARTGCQSSGGTCQTADCQSNGGNNACPVGDGFAAPSTLAEITMQRNTVDSYDISIINGTNVGVEMTPTTTNTYPFVETGIASYSCQSPGNPVATTSFPSGENLGACDWNGFDSILSQVTYPTSDRAVYVYVNPDPANISCTAATQSSVCTNTGYTRCGLSYDSTSKKINEVCGAFLGYLTGNQVCSFANTNLNPNPPADLANPGDQYFDCDTALANPLSNYTYWALYACKAQGSDFNTCYNTAANPPESTTNCCGCVNWQNATGPDGNPIVVPSNTTTCVNYNTQWTQTGGLPGVLDSVNWLKEACPTAYVYPYDDKASGFQCQNIAGSHTTNTVNYTITFCPTA
jgi:hypothetical protein